MSQKVALNFSDLLCTPGLPLACAQIRSPLGALPGARRLVEMVWAWTEQCTKI